MTYSRTNPPKDVKLRRKAHSHSELHIPAGFGEETGIMELKHIIMITLLVIQVSSIAAVLYLSFTEPKAGDFDEYERKIEQRYNISKTLCFIAWLMGPLAVLLYGFTTFVIQG